MLRVVENRYDSNNNLRHQIHYANPIAGVDEPALLRGAWEPELAGKLVIETTIYDASNRLLIEINGDNFVKEHLYDALGNKKATIAYSTPLELDTEARLGLLSAPSMTSATTDRLHKWFYDADKNLIGEQLPSMEVIGYSRNARGDLLIEKTTLGPVPAIENWQSDLFVSEPYTIDTYELDARGQCLRHTNAEQAITIQVHDAAGRLVEERVGSYNRKIQWTLANQISEEIHSSGLSITKEYAACGKIAALIKRDTLEVNSSPRSNYYLYNGFGNKISELTPRAALTFKNANRAQQDVIWKTESLRYDYNDAELVIRSQDELSNATYHYYNPEGELRFSINPDGYIVEQAYDALCSKRSLIRHYATALTESEYSLIKGGFLTPEIQRLFESKRSGLDAEEKLLFDKRGLIQTKIDAECYETHYTYDAFHNLVQQRQTRDEKNELLIQMQYDKADRMLEKKKDVKGRLGIERWIYLDKENKVEYIDARQNRHLTYFDKVNRKVREVDPLGNEIRYAWNELSKLTSITDPMGNITEVTYENHDRRVTHKKALSFKITEKNAFDEIEIEKNKDGLIAKKVYEVDGQIKLEIDANQNSYENTYNGAGWLTSVIDPLGKKTAYSYSKTGHIKEQVEEGLEQGRRVTFERDAQGREIVRKDAAGISIKTMYDKRGLITDKIIDPEGLGLYTRYNYDGLANIILEIKGSKAYPEQLKKQLNYDNSSNLVEKIIDPNGLSIVSQMQYDLLGNCNKITELGNVSSGTCYDAASQRRYSIDPLGGVIGYLYNKNGYCIEERHYFKAIDLKEVKDFSAASIEKLIESTEEDKVIYQTYDSDNNLIARLNENLLFTTFQYNAQGKKTLEYKYATAVSPNEFMKKVIPVTAQDRQAAWFYDNSGNERFSINEEGIVTERSWNKKGWLTELRVYATTYFNYTKCPVRQALAQDEDRTT